MEPKEFDQALVAYAAAIDQIVEVFKPALRAVGQYHAACVSMGVPPAVADVLTLRFAARMLVLPDQAEGAWGGSS